MQTILVVFHLFLAIGIVALVLIQHGKGADAGAAFGSGASATVFGARGSTSFLSKATAILAALFFATSMALAYYASQVGKPQGIMDRVSTNKVPIPSPESGSGDNTVPIPNDTVPIANDTVPVPGVADTKNQEVPVPAPKPTPVPKTTDVKIAPKPIVPDSTTSKALPTAPVVTKKPTEPTVKKEPLSKKIPAEVEITPKPVVTSSTVSSAKPAIPIDTKIVPSKNKKVSEDVVKLPADARIESKPVIIAPNASSAQPISTVPTTTKVPKVPIETDKSIQK